MKRLVACCLAAALSSGFNLAHESPAGRASSHHEESFRLQYHFSPLRNWMNDPNGPVFYKGEYHLFFQYNPFGNDWGHMSWGHAVSSDLIHWSERPVALSEEKDEMIFSGSTVVDRHNTSSLCTAHRKDDQSCLIAIYTAASSNRQSQSLAYSNDNGRTWVKYSGNPVLDLGLRDFRDPKVVWHELSHKWIMTVSLAAEHKIRFFSSPDLKHWTKLSDFGPAGADGGVWECPDLLELPIEGKPGQTRWLLSVNLNPGGVAGGSGNQYFIGRLDGTKFIAENEKQTLWADYGSDFYASTSFANMPSGDGRKVWLGWLDNWNYAQKLPTHPWRGAQSLPRVLSLRNTPQGARLIQEPIEELRGLREQQVAIDASDLAAASRDLRGKHFGGETLEILADIDPGSASTVGLKVRKGDREETLIGADLANSTVFVDRTHSGGDFLPDGFAAKHSGPLKLIDGKHVVLHIFVDRASVELFANDGETVISDQIFPSPQSQDVELYETGGKSGRVKIQIWRLKSVWR